MYITKDETCKKCNNFYKLRNTIECNECIRKTNKNDKKPYRFETIR